MDLTAAIRRKIDRLRNAKTTRYHALTTAVERELVVLTGRSTDLFTKLEDALEADVLGKSEEGDKLKDDLMETEAGNDEEEEEKVEEQPIRGKHTETVPEVYEEEVSEDVKDMYYGKDAELNYYDRRGDSNGYYEPVEPRQPTTSLYAGIRPPSRTPSLSTKAPQRKHDDVTTTTTKAPSITDQVPTTKPSDAESEMSVTVLRSRAQETQDLLVEKQSFLLQLRQKHDLAMKRLDKLQADLEKVSQRWEEEERARIQTETTTALGKRKRDEEDAQGSKKNWRNIGLKSVEWGVFFGIGVVSAMGMNKFQHS